MCQPLHKGTQVCANFFKPAIDRQGTVCLRLTTQVIDTSLIGSPMKVDVRNDIAQALKASFTLPEARVQAPQASQQSAAEEVGMLFSQQVESRSKALSQRTARVASVETQVQKIQSIQQLTELYEQLGHPGQVSLGQLARLVRFELLSKPSVESLLTLTGDDPTRTHVVLQYVATQAQAEGRERDALQSSVFQEQLHAQFDQQIQAGMNIALALKMANGDPSVRQAVRNLYYASVVLKQSLVTIMQALLGLFGEEGVSAGLGVMSRALADDIAAYRPSQPTSKLRTLLIGLQSCSQLGGVLNSCRQFLQRLPSPELQIEHAAVTLLQRLLGYASTGIECNEIQCLSREFGGDSPCSQLTSLNRLYPLVQRLPLAVWSDPKSRQDTLQTFLKLMSERAHAEGIGQPAPGLSRPLR